jgi:hypothetical protein
LQKEMVATKGTNIHSPVVHLAADVSYKIVRAGKCSAVCSQPFFSSEAQRRLTFEDGALDRRLLIRTGGSGGASSAACQAVWNN